MNTVSPADPGDTHLVDDATPPRGIPTFPDRADSSSSGASQREVDGRDEASPAPGDGPVPLPQPVASQVTAVIVTNGHTPYLRPLLVSLVGHDLLPGRIVLADVSAEGTAQLPSGLSWPVRPEIVRVPGAKNFGSAVSRALAQVDPPVREQWLWLFHDDCVVHSGALSALLRVVEYSASVQVIGAKHVRYGAPSDLLDVGYSVAPGGRRFTGVEPGEYDQGQHDGRDDVYAVGLTGALVYRDLWVELGGTDPGFGRYGDSLEFCRRARLHGARVVVAPQAVVEHAQASLLGLRGSSQLLPTPRPTVLDDDVDEPSFAARLSGQRLFAASNRPFIAFPFVVLFLLILAPFRALARIARKQPRRAWTELLSPLGLAARVGQVFASRRRIVKARRVPLSVLAPMQVSLADLVQFYRDRRLARSALRRQLFGLSELDRREVRALAAKRRSVFVVLLSMLAVVTAVAMRDLLPAVVDRGRLMGGALVSADGGWSDLWRVWSSGWVRDGLGASAPADPLVQTLAPVVALTAGNMQWAVNITVVAVLLASGVGAWFAAGAVSRSVVIRLWASLFWVASPALLVAVGQGRLGALIAHSALPWLVVALVRACGVQARDVLQGPALRHERRQDEQLRAQLAERDTVAARPVAEQSVSSPRQSLAALGGAALVFAVLTAAAPVLLLPGVVLVGTAAVFTRTRALWCVPLPALAVLGPLLLRAVVNWDVGGWRIMFADPGAPFPYDVPDRWQLLLGLPVAVDVPLLSDGWSSAVVGALPFVAGALVLTAALLALMRRGTAVRAVRFSWWVVVLGLATAVASSSVVVAASGGQFVTGWAGAGVSVVWLGLLGACVSAADGLVARTHDYSFGWRQVALGVAGLLVLVVPVGSLALWSDDRVFAGEDSPLQRHEGAVIPAVAQQMQSSGRAARVLLLDSVDDDRVRYQLVHHDGPHLFETSTVVNVAQLGGRPDDIAEIVAHVARGLEAEDGPSLVFLLAQQGIGSVFVPGDDPVLAAQLTSRIDRVAGIERVSSQELGTLWRVNPLAVDPAQATAAPVGVPSLAGGMTAGDQEPERVTVIAGEPAWAVVYEVGSDRSGDAVLGRPQAVSAGPLTVSSTLPSGQGERLLVLAENAAPGWHASVQGRSLVPTEVQGMQAFKIPASAYEGQSLAVSYERSSQLPWLILQCAVLVVFTFLAIPVRRKGGGA